LSKDPFGKGSNSTFLRAYNERVILRILRRMGTASKADLARNAYLTDNTAGQIVKSLSAEGLIRAGPKLREGKRGQPATQLSLDPSGAYSIGLKFGRRAVEGTLVDFAGETLQFERTERAFPLPDEAMSIALDGILSMKRSIPAQHLDRLVGIGVAIPYHMGSWRRELDIPDSAYVAWDSFDIQERLSDSTGLPVFVENDGTAAAIAELFKGHGRYLDSFLHINIGAAIGGGVILNGDYRRGATGHAGHIALIPVPHSHLPSAPTPNTSMDILLSRASVNSLIRHLRWAQADVDSISDLDEALKNHPAPFDEWMDDCVDALVPPLLAASCLLDVAALVVDGALPAAVLDDLAGRLQSALNAAKPESFAPPKILRGTIGRPAGTIGAAILPLHLNFNPNKHFYMNPKAESLIGK
jgi:predicted NBD/HSP70 family sugar kinase